MRGFLAMLRGFLAMPRGFLAMLRFPGHAEEFSGHAEGCNMHVGASLVKTNCLNGHLGSSYCSHMVQNPGLRSNFWIKKLGVPGLNTKWFYQCQKFLLFVWGQLVHPVKSYLQDRVFSKNVTRHISSSRSSLMTLPVQLLDPMIMLLSFPGLELHKC